jgi:hypothetical protein
MYIINIPQGASGRLKLDHSDYYKIKGLYTSGFSTCNILACIGKNRLALFHFDSLSSILQFNDDLEWVLQSNSPEDTDVVVIYRASGQEFNNAYHEYLQDLASKKHQVIQKSIDHEKYDGIFIAFDNSSYNAKHKNHLSSEYIIHNNIHKLLHNIKPLGTMVHHPLEEQFVTTRKINQLTGLQKKKQLHDDYIETGIIKAFNDHCIFLSGSMWQNIDQKHLELDMSDPFVKNIMDNFSKQDSYLDIAKKINPITEKILIELGFEYIMPMTAIAINLEEYLHNCDYLEIFKHNIKSLRINNNEFKKNLYNLLDNSNDFIKINKFITDNLFEFALEQPILIKYFEQHYKERSIYDVLKQQYTSAEQQAKALIIQGDQYFAVKQYQAAVEKYLDAADAIIVRAMHGNSLVMKIRDRLTIAESKLAPYINIDKYFLPLQQNQQEEPPSYLNSKLFKGCEPPPGNHKIENSRTVILSPH